MEKNGDLKDSLRKPLKKAPRKEESSLAKRDGIYKRKDRSGYWISWIDAQGYRKYRKTDATTLTQAINVRAAELVRVEQSKVLGFAPPGEESFADIAARFVLHQKARLSPKAFEREKGIVEKHLPLFSVQKFQPSGEWIFNII